MPEPNLIAVDADALERVLNRLDAIEKKLDGVRMEPQRRWISVAEAAEKYGKSINTIRRWKMEGRVKTHNGLILNPEV